ncbi:MAG: hypothetical protein K6E79_06270 [Pseudobutyrivibrio sp.]|nr:hypothetical protein [Pseudobutyrivibrio sp.]
MAKYNIGGVIFNDEASAKKAAKELKVVEYILGQLKTADEDDVLKVYNKLLDQNLFTTEVGISFLEQLRTNLLSSGKFSADQIRDVQKSTEETISNEPKEIFKEDISDIKEEKKIADKKIGKKTKSSKKEPVDSQVKRLRIANRFLIVACIALLLCVLGMFYVSTTINSPTILNYEEKIVDKYSSWEQQLTEREKAVSEREKQLEQ